ncbi:MCE family protein [Gordonia sp. NPDC003425]
MSRKRALPTFREMPRRRVAVIGISLTVAIVVLSLSFDRIPALFAHGGYRAYFAEVGNLRSGDRVELSGVDVGKVGDITLSGNKVLVSFDVKSPVRLGDSTRVAIVTTSALGKRALRVMPAGIGEMSHDDPIPLERTVAPYSLSNALDDAGGTLSGTDDSQLDSALRATSDTLDAVAPSLSAAMTGVQRLSTTIGSRDDQLRTLLSRSRDLTGLLAQRSGQLNTLVNDAAILLGQLQSRSQELERLIIGTRFLAQQLSGLLQENQARLTPALTKLHTVLGVLEKNRDAISKAIPGLRNFSMGLGESVATGPFFTAYVGNLVPVAYLQPLVDAIVRDSPPSAQPPKEGTR